MPEKARAPMLFKWEFSAKVTVARDLQQRKARRPMLVTVAGMNTLETLVEAIGLPKCKVCTHCFDGSSCF